MQIKTNILIVPIAAGFALTAMASGDFVSPVNVVAGNVTTQPMHRDQNSMIVPSPGSLVLTGIGALFALTGMRRRQKE